MDGGMDGEHVTGNLLSSAKRAKSNVYIRNTVTLWPHVAICVHDGADFMHVYLHVAMYS